MLLVLIIVLFIAAFCAWQKLAEAKKKEQRKLDKILSEYDFEKRKLTACLKPPLTPGSSERAKQHLNRMRELNDHLCALGEDHSAEIDQLETMRQQSSEANERKQRNQQGAWRPFWSIRML